MALTVSRKGQGIDGIEDKAGDKLFAKIYQDDLHSDNESSMASRLRLNDVGEVVGLRSLLGSHVCRLCATK
jgi:hypothetical protein